MEIHWPDGEDGHEKLKKVKLGIKTIWDIGDWNSPTVMPPWTSPGKDREIGKFDHRKLEFHFEEDAEDVNLNDYSLVITFDTGCTLTP